MPSRTRSRGYYSPTSTVSNVNGSISSNVYANRVGTVEYMSDYVTPGFSDLIRKGGIINSPMSRTREIRIPSQGSVLMVHPDGTRISHTGDYLAFRWPDYVSSQGWTIDTDSLTAAAVNQAYAGLTQGYAMLPVTVAERKKTLSMIADRASHLGALALAVATRNRKAFLRIAGVSDPRNAKLARRLSNKSLGVSRLWLEYRYGWLPTVMDMVGLAKALKEEKFPRYTSRGFAKGDRSDVIQFTDNAWGNGNGGMPWQCSDTITEYASARSYVLYTIDPDYQLANRVGLFDPAGTAWELVPWSFVIDRVVNIGDWLQAMSPKIGIKILATGCTVERVYQSTRTLEKALNYGPYAITGLDGLNQTVNGMQKWRSPNVSPSLLPPVHVNISTKFVVDLIALAVTNMRRVL